MPMNTTLLAALKEIISEHGGLETLSDSRRVRALLSDLAANEPKPQKNALVACLEQGFPAMLQNAQAVERGQVKTKLTERLNREEGLDAKLCADTLDLLEAALFGSVSAKPGPAVTPAPKTPATAPPSAAGAERTKAPPDQQPAQLKDQDSEVWREPRTLKGHTEPVQSVAYSPNGLRIVSGSDDSTIRIWDAENGRELRTLKGHTSSVYSVAYSPDGRRIVSGSDDSTIRIWDAESGRELRTLEGHTSLVNSVAYSPDGRRIVSGAMDSTIRIWDAENGRELWTLKGGSFLVSLGVAIVFSVAYSPDGFRIVSGASEIIKIWDAENGRELQSLEGHTFFVRSVAYSPDGRRIVSGSLDKTIKIWGKE
jgi:WD40 repeat protein